MSIIVQRFERSRAMMGAQWALARLMPCRNTTGSPIPVSSNRSDTGGSASSMRRPLGSSPKRPKTRFSIARKAGFTFGITRGLQICSPAGLIITDPVFG